ncbi:MAG: Ldh family oxidoreductase [Burkholderiales bacterium]
MGRSAWCEHGSRVASLSASPIAIALPGSGGEPIVLDIATSMIPFSKLRQARLMGTPVPEGAAIEPPEVPKP